MGFALFSNAQLAIAAKVALQGMYAGLRRTFTSSGRHIALPNFVTTDEVVKLIPASSRCILGNTLYKIFLCLHMKLWNLVPIIVLK